MKRRSVIGGVWIASASLLVILLQLLGCGRKESDTTQYFVAATGSPGTLVLASSDSDRQVRVRLPNSGATSVAAVFKGSLVLGCSYRWPDPSAPDPGLGLWVISLSDGKISRCNEAGLPGPVYMCAVFGDALWFLEGSRLWSTKDLEHFELRQTDVRSAFVASASTIVMQRRNRSLFWLKISGDLVEYGEFDKSFGGSSLDGMFGDYAFANDWGVLHLPVPDVEANKAIFPPTRDPDWAFRAFFDTRYNDWICARNSVTLLYSVCHVRTSNDTKKAFTVKANSIRHVIKLSRDEYDSIMRITARWQVK